MDWTTVTDWLLSHGVRIAIIIAIALVIYFVMHHTVRRVVRQSLSITMKDMPQEEIKKREETLTWLFYTTGKIVIGVIALVLIMAEAGINVGAMLAGLGVAGIAIAFAAQSFIKDLIAGFIISIENQYNVGDVASVGGVTGIVEAMNLRRTALRDLDGILHIVPNGEIRVTSNYTKVWARANLDIGVAYKEDADEVMSIMKRIWEEMAEDPDWGPSIISKAPSILRVNELGDSAVVIKLVGDTKAMQQWGVMGEFRRRIKKVFDEQGIEIPWPHTKVYFGDIPEHEVLEKSIPGKVAPQKPSEGFRPPKEIIPPSEEEEGD
ncbi:MAG: mechanosensitive ion channel family protein [Dehalococcoidia bacterium]|nr:mechanosensitive ion channel family protein [Dehalococcoidia bacterium]